MRRGLGMGQGARLRPRARVAPLPCAEAAALCLPRVLSVLPGVACRALPIGSVLALGLLPWGLDTRGSRGQGQTSAGVGRAGAHTAHAGQQTERSLRGASYRLPLPGAQAMHTPHTRSRHHVFSPCNPPPPPPGGGGPKLTRSERLVFAGHGCSQHTGNDLHSRAHPRGHGVSF